MLTAVMMMKYDTGLEPTRQDYPEVASLREPQLYQTLPSDWQLRQQQQYSGLNQQYNQQHQVYGEQNQLWEQQQQQQPYQQSYSLPYTHDHHSIESSNGTKHENPF